MAENVRNYLAYQIRALREQRGWSQSDLAEKIGTKQSVVSRLEDPDYGRVTLSSLIKVANAFDVAFTAQYCSFSEAIFRTTDVSPVALHVKSFSETEFVHKPDADSPITTSAILTGARPVDWSAKPTTAGEAWTKRVALSSQYQARPAEAV